VPEISADCYAVQTALVAAALAIASTSLAVCAFVLAYVAKVVHEWRTWRK
jgi:hypothetical protein